MSTLQMVSNCGKCNEVTNHLGYDENEGWICPDCAGELTCAKCGHFTHWTKLTLKDTERVCPKCLSQQN